MANYRFSDIAELDLDAIVDYTLEQWGSAQLTQYIDGMQERCQILANNPDIGTKRDSLSEGLFSFPYQSHVLYYVKSSDNIIIVRVLHKQMDPYNHIETH